MIAVILAGGKGTRLGDLAKESPKPMLPIAGKPILEHQINCLKKYGFKEYIFLTNHLSEIIEEYFGDGSKWGVSVRYIREKEPLGTAGSVKAVEQELTEDFLVTYGDVMFDVDIERLLSFHRKNQSSCTITLHPNSHPYDSDLVELNSKGRVSAFHAKPHPEGRYFHNLTNACLYILSPALVREIPKGSKLDFGKNVFPDVYKKIPMYGFVTAEYLKDMGTPERYKEVENDFITGKIARLNLKNQRKAIFLDRDGVINKDLGHVHRTEDFELLPKAVEAIKKINVSEYLAIVTTNQPQVSRNMCTFKELDEIHRKMESLLGEEGAKLDGIYFCPHHPDSGFPEENPALKIECDCRKPGIKMVLDAKEKFNIDLGQSYIIGDSWRDIECGENAGLKTIAVMKNGESYDKLENPDHKAENILQAVDLVMRLDKKENKK